MKFLTACALLLPLVNGSPIETPSRTVHAIEDRAAATCTVTAYASISAAVKACSNIVLSNISAPPSSTIDLQNLQTGAVVSFAGTTVCLCKSVLASPY